MHLTTINCTFVYHINTIIVRVLWFNFYPWFNFDFLLFFSLLIYDNEYKTKKNRN